MTRLLFSDLGVEPLWLWDDILSQKMCPFFAPGNWNPVQVYSRMANISLSIQLLWSYRRLTLLRLESCTRFLLVVARLANLHHRQSQSNGQIC